MIRESSTWVRADGGVVVGVVELIKGVSDGKGYVESVDSLVLLVQVITQVHFLYS